MSLWQVLQFDFIIQALIAATLAGLAAPAIGIYLVHRRLALMGDGIGHVALTGVAIGLLTQTNPVLTALLAAAAGGIAVELVRMYGRTTGDMALAMLFYAGLASGVLLMSMGTATNTDLLAYLFGSPLTASTQDVWAMAVVAVCVLGLCVAGRAWFFAVCHDEEYARVAGLPVRFLTLLIAVLAAVTVTVAMRVVGVLLVSALMVVPVAAAQRLTRGFTAAMLLAIVFGAICASGGVIASFYLDTPTGATIVTGAIALFIVVVVGVSLGNFIRRQERFRRFPGTIDGSSQKTMEKGRPTP